MTGKISVYSDGEGKGSAFRFEIPMMHDLTTNFGDNTLDNCHDRTLEIDDCSDNLQITNRSGNSELPEYLKELSRSFKVISPTSALKLSFSNNQLGLNESLPTLAAMNVETRMNCNDDPDYYSNYDFEGNFGLNPESGGKEENKMLIKDKNKLNFLVVDDSSLNKKMLCRSLRVEGHSCDEAEDGLVALHKVKEKFDLYNRLKSQLGHSSTLAAVESSELKSQLGQSSTLDAVDASETGLCSNHDDWHKVKEICGLYDVILMDSVMPNMEGPVATKEILKLGYKGPIIGITGLGCLANF